MTIYIGLDVHSKWTYYAAQSCSGALIAGGRRRHGHITRSGPAAVRAVLCEAAHQAARAAHPLNPYWRRICSRGGYRKAVVAVAQRLARILWALWRRGEPFDVGRLNVELHPHAVRRTYIYRLGRPA